MYCPTCRKGTLELGKVQHYLDANSVAAVAVFEHTGPEELSGTFTVSAVCLNHRCKQSVVLAGDWRTVFDYDDDYSRMRYIDEFKLRYVNPALTILSIPEGTPPGTVQAIESAAALVWINPNAAANQLRQSLELLLTTRAIKVGPTLHDRIIMFRKTEPEVADALMAVKWIGNSGSHDSALSVEEVLTGAKILELALRNLYDTTDADLMARVRQINANKGLPKPTT